MTGVVAAVHAVKGDERIELVFYQHFTAEMIANSLRTQGWDAEVTVYPVD